MLNLTETIFTSKPYFQQSAWFEKIFFFSSPAVFFLDYFLFQVPEIQLLQLQPGLTITVVFSLFVFLFLFSYSFIKLIIENDSEKKRGTKTFLRPSSKSILKLFFTIYLAGLYEFFNLIIPISFESFALVTESNSPNLWSINEFLGVERSLSCLLFFGCCLPIFIIYTSFSWKEIYIFPTFKRNYIFFVSLFSGVLTPTVDAATQLNFIIIGISFYFLVITFLKKTSLRYIFF